MPRLVCTFGRFIEIIEGHGFVPHGKPKATSHRKWRRVVSGKVYIVDVAAHRMGDEIKPGTLKSMIRQSGLDQSLFRR